MGLWLADWDWTTLGDKCYYKGVEQPPGAFEKVRKSYNFWSNVYCAVWTIAGTLFIVALTMM